MVWVVDPFEAVAAEVRVEEVAQCIADKDLACTVSSSGVSRSVVW